MTVMRAAKVAVLGVAALALGSCSVVGGGGGGGGRGRLSARSRRLWFLAVLKRPASPPTSITITPSARSSRGSVSAAS